MNVSTRLARKAVALVAAAALFLSLAPVAPADDMAGAPPGAASPPLALEDLVPAGTLVLVEAPDPESACAALSGTDLGKLMKLFDPFVQQMWAGLKTGLAEPLAEMERETGLTLDHILAIASGGAAFALVDIEQETVTETYGEEKYSYTRENPILAFAVRGGKNPAVLKKAYDSLRAKAPKPEDGAPAGYQVDGVQVDQIDVVHAFWIGDNLYAAVANFRSKSGPDPAKALVEDMVRAARKAAGVAPRLAQDGGFQTVKSKVVRGPAPLVLAFVNGKPIFEKIAKSEGERDAAAMEAFGLLDLGASGLAFGAGPDGRVELALHVGASAESRRGLLAMLPSGSVDVAAAARLAPASAVSFSASEWDLLKAYDALVAADPTGDLRIKKGLAELEEEVLGGMRLRDDFLANLGSSWTMWSFVPEGGAIPEMIVSVSLRNGRKFRDGLLRVLHAVGLEAADLPNGIEYIRVPLGKLGDDPFRGNRNEMIAAISVVLGFLPGSWVEHEGRLYLGSTPQALGEYLDWRKQGGAKTLADNPAFQAELAKAPRGVTGFGFEDPRFLPVGYELGSKLLKFVEPLVRAAGVDMDLALLPRGRAVAAEIRPGSSSMVVDAGGYTFSGRLTATSVAVAGGATAVVAATATYSVARQRAMMRQWEEEEMMQRKMEEEMRRLEEEEKRRAEEEKAKGQ